MVALYFAEMPTSMSDLTHDFLVSMRRLACSVSVITCCDGEGRWHGMTATSVTSLSMKPASLLVCVNQSSRFYAAIKESTRFCVNVLSFHQVEVSAAFSGQTSPVARFQIGNWSLNAEGVPALDSAQASVSCEVDQVHEYATHMIFIGRVLACETSPTVSPLIYQNGGYSRAMAVAG